MISNKALKMSRNNSKCAKKKLLTLFPKWPRATKSVKLTKKAWQCSFMLLSKNSELWTLVCIIITLEDTWLLIMDKEELEWISADVEMILMKLPEFSSTILKLLLRFWTEDSITLLIKLQWWNKLSFLWLLKLFMGGNKWGQEEIMIEWCKMVA